MTFVWMIFMNDEKYLFWHDRKPPQTWVHVYFQNQEDAFKSSMHLVEVGGNVSVFPPMLFFSMVPVSVSGVVGPGAIRALSPIRLF